MALVVGDADWLAGADLSGFPVTWQAREAAIEVAAARGDGATQLHAGRENELLVTGRVVSMMAPMALPVPQKSSAPLSIPPMSNMPQSNLRPDAPGWKTTSLLSRPVHRHR